MDIGQNSETHEFLEKCLGEKIKSFVVGPGTKAGDGYSALHYAFEVQFEKPDLAPRKLFLKGFPNHPMRQEMSKNLNPFFKEYKLYCEIVPNFYKLQKEITGGSTPIELSIPDIISANAILYKDSKSNVDGNPEDNYILMADMTKFGFTKFENHNFHRINYNEAEKIVEELAKFHALSWAYKKTHGISTLSEKYPYWTENFFIYNQKGNFITMMDSSEKLFLDFCKQDFGEQSPIFKAANEFFDKKNWDHWDTTRDLVNSEGINEKEIEKILKKPYKEGLADPIEDSWTVLTQSDPWINNMLFKFDSEGQAEKSLLLDFQYSRESCPTIELAFVLYVCADLEFRKKYLNQILRFYHKTFLGFCETLKVPTFPNFTIENLERRFYRARIFGILNAVWFTPFLLNNPDKVKNGENIEAGKDGNGDLNDYIGEMYSNSYEGTPLKQTLLEIAKEAYELGLF